MRVNAESVFASYEALNISLALTEIWSYISDANQWIVQTAPWNVAKDPARAAELNAFLYRLAERVRVLALLASPVIPSSAGKVLDMLGLAKGSAGRTSTAYGLLTPGQPLGAITPLFPRIELKKAVPAAEEKPHTVNDEIKTPNSVGTVIARSDAEGGTTKQPRRTTTKPVGHAVAVSIYLALRCIVLLWTNYISN